MKKLLPVLTILFFNSLASGAVEPAITPTPAVGTQGTLTLPQVDLNHLTHLDSRVLHEMTQLAGGWSGGGGSGVACFQNEKAKLANLAADGTIPFANRKNILSLKLLDYFYREPLQKFFMKPRLGEHAVDFLDRVVAERVAPTNEVIARRLKLAIHLVDESHWNFSPEPFAFRQDTGQGGGGFMDYLLQSHPECAQVQIAYRFMTKTDNRVPTLALLIDGDYVEKLVLLNGDDGVFNEAVLIFHEAVYALLSQLGLDNSGTVPNLVSLMLGGEQSAFELRARMAEEGFNRIASLYSGEYPTNPEKDLLQKAYRSLTSKKIEILEKAICENPDFSQILTDYRWILNLHYDEVAATGVDYDIKGYTAHSVALAKFARKTLATQISSSEAFMATAVEAWRTRVIKNFDVFMAAEVDHQADRAKTCGFARGQAAIAPAADLKIIFQKAVAYCSGIVN